MTCKIYGIPGSGHEKQCALPRQLDEQVIPTEDTITAQVRRIKILWPSNIGLSLALISISLNGKWLEGMSNVVMQLYLDSYRFSVSDR